ncbi:MAG: glycosyltransferase family 9 protein [Flavobacterium sp.]|nr:glycosyltransferase family 9 protein [Flavobacterium sp.]
MKKFTKNIGKTNYNKRIEHTSEIVTILISRPNQRLGNLLLITPLVQEITATFPNCKIDLFVKGNQAESIFRNYENINHIIQLPIKPFSNIMKYVYVWLTLKSKKYDLVINASENSSSGKLSTFFSNAKYKFYGEFNDQNNIKYSDYIHSAKFPVYNLRSYLNKVERNEKPNVVPFLDLKLNSFEMERGKKSLNQITHNDNKTICLFTNATGEKCYSEEWWNTLYEKLKNEFSNYNIIEILPVENTSKLGFKIPTFYSTDIREIGSLIANADLFIGADSGLMHLSSAVGTPTIGLFSVTDEKVYKPYNKKGLAINTNNVKNIEMLDLINIYLNNPFAKA